MGIWEDFAASGMNLGRFWPRLDPDTRLLAANSFYQHDFEDGGVMRARADARTAAAMNFRVSAIRKLPAERRARSLALARQLEPEMVASMLTALHFEARSEMMAAFLDDLGIEHQNGVIPAEHGVLINDSDRLAAAVKGLFAKYPAHQVELYLVVLYGSDPESWKMIETVMAKGTEGGEKP